MSIYQGFATRSQENNYMKQIVNLIRILQRRLMKFYLSQQVDESAFKKVFSQTYQQIKEMEQSKYREPFYSQYLDDISNYLGINKNTPKPNSSQCCCKCHQPKPDTIFITNYQIQNGTSSPLPEQQSQQSTKYQSNPSQQKQFRSSNNPPQNTRYQQQLTNFQQFKTPLSKLKGIQSKLPNPYMSFSITRRQTYMKRPNFDQKQFLSRTNPVTMRSAQSTPQKNCRKSQKNRSINISNPNESNH